MINLASFSDELQKIAEERAIYSPSVVAHEAGHAQVHKNRSLSLLRRVVPALAGMYSGSRMTRAAIFGGGMSTPEFAAVSAAANAPVIADEAAASIIGMKGVKKSMGKEEWKRAALQLASINSSYLAGPLVDVATIGAAKAGAPALAQIGLQLAGKSLVGGAWSSLGMMADGPKVTAREAKKIVGAVAPKGTPTFAIKEPIPGGSQYVPPAKSPLERELVGGAFGGVMGEKDLKVLQSKGGVLIAPLDAKTQLRSSIPLAPPVTLKTKFRRLS